MGRLNQALDYLRIKSLIPVREFAVKFPDEYEQLKPVTKVDHFGWIRYVGEETPTTTSEAKTPRVKVSKPFKSNAKPAHLNKRKIYDAKLRASILACLQEHPWCQVSTLKEFTKADEHSINARLLDMEKQGMVQIRSYHPRLFALPDAEMPKTSLEKLVALYTKKSFSFVKLEVMMTKLGLSRSACALLQAKALELGLLAKQDDFTRGRKTCLYKRL